MKKIILISVFTSIFTSGCNNFSFDSETLNEKGWTCLHSSKKMKFLAKEELKNYENNEFKLISAKIINKDQNDDIKNIIKTNYDVDCQEFRFRKGPVEIIHNNGKIENYDDQYNWISLNNKGIENEVLSNFCDN